jgi:DNA-directed RNA polymerase subunit RPC12/RpoP
VNIQLDFNTLIQQLGNKGISLTSIQCTQCGSPCGIPGTGTTVKCQACGATIMVTDVFEKFKTFLE